MSCIETIELDFAPGFVHDVMQGEEMNSCSAKTRAWGKHRVLQYGVLNHEKCANESSGMILTADENKSSNIKGLERTYYTGKVIPATCSGRPWKCHAKCFNRIIKINRAYFYKDRLSVDVSCHLPRREDAKLLTESFSVLLLRSNTRTAMKYFGKSLILPLHVHKLTLAKHIALLTTAAILVLVTLTLTPSTSGNPWLVMAWILPANGFSPSIFNCDVYITSSIYFYTSAADVTYSCSSNNYISNRSVRVLSGEEARLVGILSGINTGARRCFAESVVGDGQVSAEDRRHGLAPDLEMGYLL
ncbi:hypothetical protein PR048_022688 [Dryococelus australis]|uniref:Uncharacterized protein n=1 Tax=Dryococelus australis TaxID=614101 RepID=A0ABQ9GS37_9NEOP|nr:hypothetical protein PR048_022688 [Dryococelus australis]